jgi:tetratricopeptide (TPR) repeat protein
VVVFEDLHWAEPTLLDLVEYLAAWAVDAPLLIICLARPELRDARPRLGADADVIALEPLEDSAADALVSELGGPDVTPESRERIVALAEGNPLFVEQLLAFVEEAGAERLESVPPTVEALLASRLDRLEPEERAVLERAAVVGREFGRADVVHLTPPDELAGLDARLRHLARRGLISALRTPDREDRLRFHHILIRDVAYAGITKEARAALHERFATWLERRDAYAQEIVGYHLEQAHRYRAELRPADPELPALAERAGDQLASAGIRAWKRADTPTAVNLLGRATGLLPVESANRVELLCELGVARRVLGDFEGGEKTLVDACALAVRDRRVLLRAEIELAFLRLLSETHGSSDLIELAAKAIPVFEELEDDRALGRTWRHVGYVRSFEGRLGDWQEAVELAVVHYRRSGWSASGCLGELAAALFYGPTSVPEALERCEELLDDATDRAGRANVLAFISGLEAIDGRFDEARQHLAEAESTYEELGESYSRANYCLRVRGRIEMLAGDPVRAEGVFRESCEVLEHVHDEAGLSTIGAKLADALYVQARYDEAAGWLDLAEKRSSAQDVSAQYTWRRVRAKVLARAGGHRDAERLGREAAELAARTDALSDHGEVLVDLAEVLLLAGKESAAAAQVERALGLFQRKGNRVSADAAKAMLSELTLAQP